VEKGKAWNPHRHESAGAEPHKDKEKRSVDQCTGESHELCVVSRIWIQVPRKIRTVARHDIENTLRGKLRQGGEDDDQVTNSVSVPLLTV
jgi:uncharacterized protein YifE (UPF0438 family)